MSKTSEIVSAIESVLPKRRPIEHHEPFINKKRAATEIANCLASGVQNYKYVELFENWLKDLTGAGFSLVTNTGTSALHVALLASGVKRGDEVLCPVSTFVATSNSILHVGATPHFVDAGPFIDPKDLRLYLVNLPDRSKITAIVVVHLLGYPVDIDNICRIAEEFNLIVIEDASQALGTRISGKHVGTFGKVGIFSFNNNKILVTGGGGAIITNSVDIWYTAKQLASTARKPHQWLVEHESMAWNYRMGSINAALGLAGAQEFNKTLAIKQGLALRYRRALKGMIEFVESTIECEPNYWLNTILVNNRDELLQVLYDRGIRARASFTPLHLLDFYKNSLSNLYSYQYNVQLESMVKAVEFFNRAVCLPSGADL